MLGWISGHLLHLIMHQVQVRLCTDGSPPLVPMTASRSKHLMLSAAAYLPALPALPAPGWRRELGLGRHHGGAINDSRGNFLESRRCPRALQSQTTVTRRVRPAQALAKKASAKMREMMFMKYKVMKVDPVSSVFLAYFCLI